ncbi:MAG: hypothetical protein JKY23_06835 [Nitrospinaceae bacterium]|nr:hypothetical protein [Nitrospinaceae bacterium]
MSAEIFQFEEKMTQITDTMRCLISHGDSLTKGKYYPVFNCWVHDDGDYLMETLTDGGQIAVCRTKYFVRVDPSYATEAFDPHGVNSKIMKEKLAGPGFGGTHPNWIAFDEFSKDDLKEFTEKNTTVISAADHCDEDGNLDEDGLMKAIGKALEETLDVKKVDLDKKGDDDDEYR